MTLSFGQWLKVGFGGLHLLGLYRQNVPVQAFAAEAGKLIADVFPPQPTPAEQTMTHAEVLRKVTTGDMTAAEQAELDHAGQSPGGAG